MRKNTTNKCNCCIAKVEKIPVSVAIKSVDFDHVSISFGEYGEEDEVPIFQASFIYGDSRYPYGYFSIVYEITYSDGTTRSLTSYSSTTGYQSHSPSYIRLSAMTLAFTLPPIEEYGSDGKLYRTVLSTLQSYAGNGRYNSYSVSAYWKMNFTEDDAVITGMDGSYPEYADIPWEIGTEENYNVDKVTALFEVYTDDEED